MGGRIRECPGCGFTRALKTDAPEDQLCRACAFLTPAAELPGEWVNDALCLQVDPEIFFPENRDYATTNTAKTICGKCPVRTDCLAYALETHTRDGIWGGLTPDERVALMRKEKTA